MRWVLALALVVHLSGLSAAVPKACAMADGLPQHECCRRQAGATLHVTGTCGCQMTPASSAPAPSATVMVPDGQADQLVSAPVPPHTSLPAAVFAPAPRGAGPPGPDTVSASRLLASGFRC
jgi:hypothetical protein